MYTKYEENPFAGSSNTMIVGKIFGNFQERLYSSPIIKI